MKNWRQQQFVDISAAKDEASITLFMVHGVCIFGSRHIISDNEHEHEEKGVNPQANGQQIGFIKANWCDAEVHLLSRPADYKLLTSMSYSYSCWLQHNYNITDDYFIVAIVSFTLTAAFSNALSR